MADSESGYKWWLRYILIPLIGGGGLVAVLVAIMSKTEPSKIEPPKPEPSKIESPKPEASRFESPKSQASQSPASQRQPVAEVERLVARWQDAWANGRADEVVSLASEPFYFDQKVILSRPELRKAYEQLRQEKGATWRELEITRIKVQTARELQGTGYDLSKDRIFGSLNLTLDDYVAIVTVNYHGHAESEVIAVRRVGDAYEIAGVWD